MGELSLMDEVLGLEEDQDQENTPDQADLPPPDGGEVEDSDDDEPQSDSESSADPDDEEADKVIDEVYEAGDEEEANDEDEIDNDDDDDLAAARKKAKGLQQRNAELRQKNRELQAQRNLQVPVPPPPSQTTATQPEVQTRVPVIVDEHGEVHVDVNALQSYVNDQVNQGIQRANTPTPEQVQAYQRQQATVQLRNDYPGAMERAEAADDFLGEHLRALKAQGHQPKTSSEVIQLLRSQGVDKELNQHLPEVAAMFDEFVGAFISDIPDWKRSVVQRIEGTSSPSSALPPRKRPELSPRSLARLGGSRTPNVPRGEEAEFQALEAGFMKQSALFPQDKYDRLMSLGRKLDKNGY